jgi:hypothetical protein
MNLGLVGSALGSTLGSVLGGTVGGIFAMATQWVADAAVWVLGQVGHLMSATTTVDLSSSWFTQHEHVMAVLAAAVVLPMACCGVIVAVYRQDASMLVRGLLVKLPLALVFTGMSVELVRLGLAVTDNLSDRVLAAGGVDTAHVLAPLAEVLGALSVPGLGVPMFLVFVGALLVVMAALVLWLELVVRAAALSVAVLFLPLSLAGLVWPATAHWCRRLADTIAALVLSKLVVAAVISLAAGAVAGGMGGVGAGDLTGGFGAVVTGIALLIIAVGSPFLLLRLIPAIEAGAVLHLEAARHRLQDAGAFAVERSLAMATAGKAGMLNGELPAPGPVTAGAGPGGPPRVNVARGASPQSPEGEMALMELASKFPGGPQPEHETSSDDEGGDGHGRG